MSSKADRTENIIWIIVIIIFALALLFAFGAMYYDSHYTQSYL